MSAASQQHRYRITNRQIVGLTRHIVLIAICLVVLILFLLVIRRLYSYMDVFGTCIIAEMGE